MSVQNGCGIMVGLPFKDMLKYFSAEELRELIYDGQLDVGSIYYGSPYEENIVGIWLSNTFGHKLIDMTLLSEKVATMEILIPQLKYAELDTYLSLRIT